MVSLDKRVGSRGSFLCCCVQVTKSDSDVFREKVSSDESEVRTGRDALATVSLLVARIEARLFLYESGLSCRAGGKRD